MPESRSPSLSKSQSSLCAVDVALTCWSDCAECAPGYAGRNGIACTRCDDIHYMASMAALLFFTMLLILMAWVLVILYLVGGVQMVTSASSNVAGALRRSITRDRYASAPESFVPGEASNADRHPTMRNSIATTRPADSLRSEDHQRVSQVTNVERPQPGFQVQSKRILRRLVRRIPFRKLRIMIGESFTASVAYRGSCLAPGHPWARSMLWASQLVDQLALFVSLLWCPGTTWLQSGLGWAGLGVGMGRWIQWCGRF